MNLRLRYAATGLGLAALATACSSGDGTRNDTADRDGDEPAGAHAAGPEEGACDFRYEQSCLPELPSDDSAFVVDEGSFEVMPGEELVYCVHLPLPEPWRDEDFVLVGVDSEIPAYTHHYFMTWVDEPFPGDPDAGPVPCRGDSGELLIENNTVDVHAVGLGKTVVSAGVGVNTQRKPEGYGTLIPTGGHFVTNHHVTHLGTEPVDMYARFNLHVQPANEVPYPTNGFSCMIMEVYIPPHSKAKHTATCLAPFDVDIVGLGSHVHQHGVRVEQRIFDGERTLDEIVYASESWDNPLLYTPPEPIRLEAGQGFTFTCYYENDKDVTLRFGLQTDAEMCAMNNTYAYPTDAGMEHQLGPPLAGAVFDSATPLMLSDSTGTGLPF